MWPAGLKRSGTLQKTFSDLCLGHHMEKAMEVLDSFPLFTYWFLVGFLWPFKGNPWSYFLKYKLMFPHLCIIYFHPLVIILTGTQIALCLGEAPSGWLLNPPGLRCSLLTGMAGRSGITHAFPALDLEPDISRRNSDSTFSEIGYLETIVWTVGGAYIAPKWYSVYC